VSADRYYVVDLSSKRWQAEQLARRLVAQGISVGRLTGQTRICGKDYNDGALIVDTAQPAGRLARTLLAKDTLLPEAFIQEQEARRTRGLDWEIYDVTAWSLPLMSGVEAVSCRRIDTSGIRPVLTDIAPPYETLQTDDAFGYAVPWTDAGQAKLVLAALQTGLSAKATDHPFTIAGQTFPRGSVVFTAAANTPELGAQLDRLARDIGADIVPLSTGWTDSGPNIGSDSFKPLSFPKIAMAWGLGTRSTDAGAARYVLEQQFGLPVAPIRVRSIRRADLAEYDVVILPDTSGFADIAGEAAAEALADFAAGGGTLIGFADAVDYLANEDVGLLSTVREAAWTDAEPNEEPGEAIGLAAGTRIRDEDDYEGVIAAQENTPDSVPGVLVTAQADPDHWLSAGYDTATALFSGGDIYQPIKADAGTNVFRFAGPDDLLASGYLWDENRQQLAYKPFVMAEQNGDGWIIGFTESPVTRAYLDGLNLLLLNAVLFGPAH
ncbi:MAG: carboxypeptidase, partial [Pseudomonadota bacterium]